MRRQQADYFAIWPQNKAFGFLDFLKPSFLGGLGWWSGWFARFHAQATTAECCSMMQTALGIDGDELAGYSIFEVFGSLERNMLPWEKLADAISKWETCVQCCRSLLPTHVHVNSHPPTTIALLRWLADMIYLRSGGFP
jgi:hypothetical protein